MILNYKGLYGLNYGYFKQDSFLQIKCFAHSEHSINTSDYDLMKALLVNFFSWPPAGREGFLVLNVGLSYYFYLGVHWSVNLHKTPQFRD